MVKVTVPVGVPAEPDAATSAVKVTCSPTIDGFNEEWSVVVVVVVVGCTVAAFTVWVGSDPLLALTLLSPL